MNWVVTSYDLNCTYTAAFVTLDEAMRYFNEERDKGLEASIDHVDVPAQVIGG